MGNTVSQAVLQDYTSLLRKFSGTSRIDSEDPYWRQLFAFPASLSQVDPKLVAQTIIDCCTSLGEPCDGNDVSGWSCFTPGHC